MWTFVATFVALSLLVQAHASTNRPFVVGHRGQPSSSPENTMYSFFQAYENGADGIECDLRLTKDHVVIIMHDETLDRTTNCTGRVDELTWAEISSCQCHDSATAWKGPEPIPLFEDVLEAFAGEEIFIVMDLKIDNGMDPLNSSNPLGPYIAPLIQKYNMSSYVIASCWYPWQVADIGLLLPGVPRQVLSGGLGWTQPTFWESAVASGVNGFSLAYTNMSAHFVEMAHKQFMGVAVWTVNTADVMKQVLAYGPDAILTDYTPTLIQVMNDYYGNCATKTYEKELYVVVAIAGAFLAVIIVLILCVLRLNKRAKYAEIANSSFR